MAARSYQGCNVTKNTKIRILDCDHKVGSSNGERNPNV
jgi:hypothetical protein